MAVIYKQAVETGGQAKKNIALVLILALTLWVTLKTAPGGETFTSLSTGICVGAAVLFFILVGFRKNPLALLSWGKKSPHPYLGELLADLAQIEGHCHIFTGMTMEFFAIDCLVLCPAGIFVIRTPKHLLGQDEPLPEPETKKLWQRCHMIRMLLEKGYGQKIMPVPVLAVDADGRTDEAGILCLCPDKIAGVISGSEKRLDETLVQGFATFLAQRYLR